MSLPIQPPSRWNVVKNDNHSNFIGEHRHMVFQNKGVSVMAHLAFGEWTIEVMDFNGDGEGVCIDIIHTHDTDAAMSDLCRMLVEN